MSQSPLLTQALLLSVFGLLTIIISLIGLGPVVDEFVLISDSFELTEWGMQYMPESLLYAEWFYLSLRILGIMYLIWPIMYLFRRHKYSSPAPEDELWG